MTYKYAGFMSYSHTDEGVAARLHRALETFKIPHDLTQVAGNRLYPIFRDATELTAHHSLSEKIQDALHNSPFLIVLCSPAAKISHWVNEEIRLFRSLHGEASILCVLVEGTPETSFPPALIEGGREPLAANIGQSPDDFRLGTTQLAASMLGVGLDALIQRDTRRRRRQLQGVTAAAIGFSAFMGATTFSAVSARTAAENNRMQAEDLVEYMITDMKEKLEPVGRLDILDSIGIRAVEYYDAQDIDRLPDDSLSRQARARHILGEVAIKEANVQKALEQIESASRITTDIYDRNSGDSDAIFDHAQSEFWLGETYKVQNKYELALPHWEHYAELTAALNKIDPQNVDWKMERGSAVNNVATLHNRLGNLTQAKAKYLEAASVFESFPVETDDGFSAQVSLANTLGGLAQLSLASKNISQTNTHRQRQIKIYQDLIERQSKNFPVRFQYAQALSKMVTDGSLDANEAALTSTLAIATREYETLVAYEPDNFIWRKEYYYTLKDILKHADKNDLLIIDRKTIKTRMKSLETTQNSNSETGDKEKSPVPSNP